MAHHFSSFYGIGLMFSTSLEITCNETLNLYSDTFGLPIFMIKAGSIPKLHKSFVCGLCFQWGRVYYQDKTDDCTCTGKIMCWYQVFKCPNFENKVLTSLVIAAKALAIRVCWMNCGFFVHRHVLFYRNLPFGARVVTSSSITTCCHWDWPHRARNVRT